MSCIYTIGYSSFNKDLFIKTLKDNNINSVIDVRSSPYSKFYSCYNKENLTRMLSKSHIYYRNYKDEFGARQDNTVYYSNGYLDFNLFSKCDAFLNGMSKIIDGINQGYNFVLMCAEKDPINCHRNIMVARKFYEKGYEIKNILSDGTIELQNDLEARLVNKFYPDRNQISFLSEALPWDEMVTNSYKMQNKIIAYRIDEDELL